VSRWQQRFAEAGVEGLLRDRTRKPGKAPIAAETGEGRIARALEGAQAMRLQVVRPPDALHRAHREPHRLGHRSAGPMGRLVRRFGAEPAPAKAGVSATTRAVNASPKPFVWTKSADAILAKLDCLPVPFV
jgi:hypothetical protein